MEPDKPRNPFYAGFGNRANDALAYTSIGIEKNKVFITNPKGEIYQFDSGKITSYPKINDSINEKFPPIDPEQSNDFNYNDASYWNSKLSGSYDLSQSEEVKKK